jgi:oligopeptidase A
MSETNPLTERVATIPFQSFNASQIVPAIDRLIAVAQRELEELKVSKSARTFENTLLALDNLGLDLDFAMGLISQLESVATTPEWREAYNTVLPKVTEFRSRLILDPGLWAALKDYSRTPEAASLTGPRRRYLEKTIDSFKRSGAELSEANKEALSKLNTELANITNTFSQHTLDATNAFEYITTDPKELAGLPESAMNMGKASASAKGKEGWRFTLQAPSFIAIMTYAENRSLRERFYNAYNTRCSGGSLDNRECLYKILELRAQKAALLGFKDFSDLVLADRMAKRGQEAQRFVNELKAHINPHFERDNQELFDFIKAEYGVDKDSVKPWDIAFYVERMRKARYDFDEEELRPYFSLTSAMKGLFSIAESVFGVSVTPNKDLPVWDPGVTAYSAKDSSSGEVIGHFYADFFPRENKRGGAWMNTLLTHARSDGPDLPHVGLIAGNFTPPSGNADALLTHDEVTTLFHEFGHLMHLLCNTTELRGQSMDGVAWDFIELPSQIFENWCWDRESVDLIASHYKTGEKIPDTLFKKMLAARNFRSASHLMRQVGFSTVDLALHREYSKDKNGDVVAYCRSILSRFTSLPLPEDYAMILTFTHLFSSPVGYAAGYYSYQWAEVLDADAFSRFEREGLFNSKVGAEFRNTVLSSGDSQDPEALFESFMGRKADITALLKRSGLTAQAA